MKGKAIILCIAMLASVSLISLTACGSNEEAVSSTVESSVISETSASLGIYTYDTDNNGTPDMVVDRYGADLSELYTLKEDGIYEGENLVLPLEQTEAFVPVTEIVFTVTEKTVHPESSFTLDLVITPENATTKEVDITTDNAEVLKIENGNITALTNGEATVTATAKAGGAAATCKVIVNAEVEETETKNEEATTSGGTVYSSNTNNKNTVTSNTGTTNQSANTQTGGNIAGNSGGGNTNNNTTGGNTNSGNINGGNTTTTQPDPQPTVHAPIYKQQYVVDKAAWTEEVPVYETKEIEICNYCKSEITGNAESHLYEHALNGIATGWHSEFRQIQIGTKTIYHEEVGHWETVLVCGGCTGTH